MLRKAVFAILASSIAITASACNTVKGVGQDIESVGRKGEEVIN